MCVGRPDPQISEYVHTGSADTGAHLYYLSLPSTCKDSSKIAGVMGFGYLKVLYNEGKATSMESTYLELKRLILCSSKDSSDHRAGKRSRIATTSQYRQ